MNFKKWLLENDAEHGKEVAITGFWGKQGAGCIILAKSTKRILLPHRSRSVQEPNTWGVWGGAIDSDEIPKEAAKREVQEEAGYDGETEMIPLSVFEKGTFKYHNFLAIVDEEFEPKLNWETQDYKWVDFGDWPQPLHFGLQSLLAKDSQKIKEIIKKIFEN
jgi:8-oxo-dGTP pyrophosphatase MutT (NUDIX family)